MDIISIKSLHGPSVFHADPVIIMKVNLAELTDTPSSEINGFNAALKSLLPTLADHTCSPGYAGGFYERLASGTYLAHITEHIAIELSQLCGLGITYGKTVYVGTYGHYNIVVRFINEEGMKQCLQEAFSIVKSLINSKSIDIAKICSEIKNIALENQLGPTTQTILDAAIKRSIPFRRLSSSASLFQLGYGKKRRFFQASCSDQTSIIAADIVQDKFLTKSILQRYFLPTPQGKTVTEVSEMKQISDSFSPPYVVKPVDGNQGKGVILNLVCPIELEAAFYYAQRFSKTVLVEEMCFGDDFRILVIDGKFIAAARRTPPQVIGDGISTVQSLIDKLNENPHRGIDHESILTKIKVDEAVLQFLAKQSIHLDSVIEKNKTVVLRGNANLSSGGHAEDVTDLVHPDIKALCERTARLLNLDICGIDLVHQDISMPVNSSTKIIEVNAAPGLRMHLSSAGGGKRDIGASVMNMLYPPDESTSIPIVAVTGTNGKTTVSRLIHSIVGISGSTVGLTTTEGIWIGKNKIVSGDTTGPLSAEAVLSDPLVDAAVLEVARGGLVRGGLAYDWSDVGVITNISSDHIGQDGIESIDDLVWIKSVVAERVKVHGTLVLNADDPAALSVLTRPKVKAISKNIFLYSLNRLNLAFNEHIMSGGSGCWLDSGYIYVKKDDVVNRLLAAAVIPLTLGGVVEFQVSNVLAAVAACTGLGVDSNHIIQGLKSFNPTEYNSGRMSVYQVHQGHVILDYGHNPNALAAVSQIVENCQGFTKTAVVGLPGDRSDQLLKQCMDAVANNYHKIIIKEDADLRGRKKGEVSQILFEAVRQKNPEVQCEIILNEKEAIITALSSLGPKDLVVIFYDKLATALESLKEFDPQPKLAIPLLAEHTEVFSWNFEHQSEQPKYFEGPQ